MLEGFSDNFADEEPVVKVALLTAALKLFFRRPPECRQGCPCWSGWAGMALTVQACTSQHLPSAEGAAHIVGRSVN